MRPMNRACCNEKLLKKKGVGLTPHRQVVFEIFSSSPKTFTAQRILEKIRKKRTMDKVTLYRILDLFVAKRIIRRLSASQGSLRYEIICDEHHPFHPHFICRDCGKMECLNDIDLSSLRHSIQKKRHLEGEDIDLKLEGLCFRCRKTKI